MIRAIIRELEITKEEFLKLSKNNSYFVYSLKVGINFHLIMPEKVNKRKGYSEDFQIEKLKKSVEKAARDAGISENEIPQIVEDISNYVLESVKDLDTVDTESLRSLILAELDKKYPEVAEAWRKYDREHKGREH